MAEKNGRADRRDLKESELSYGREGTGRFPQTDGWGIQESSGGYYCGTMDRYA